MSYVNSVLQPGEQVVMTGSLHWIVYIPGFLLLLLAAASLAVGSALQSVEVGAIAAAFFLVVGLFMLFRAWFKNWTTELAVTDRRVIYKSGWISRQTSEMNMDKVETVSVDQSIFGRILDYGSVHVLGTGQGIKHLHAIASPLKLRSAITAR
jgi:uncharacterized membrane protein YdbT with pleckstrin-like domain